jgi:hypothetical protein
MEKNIELEQNIAAAKWTHEAGLYTVYQMVLGMPGEDKQTIAETTEFIKRVTEFLPEPPLTRLSINYIQALPGTPVYEYARNVGLIGPTLEDESQYLEVVSDINAADDTKFLNFTSSDDLTVRSWRPKILFEAQANWYRKNRWKTKKATQQPDSLDKETSGLQPEEDYNRGGYFNLGHAIRHPMFYRLLSLPMFYPLRVMYPTMFILAGDFKSSSKKQWLAGLKNHLFSRTRSRNSLDESISLRKVMKERQEVTSTETETEQNMLPMREGR